MILQGTHFMGGSCKILLKDPKKMHCLARPCKILARSLRGTHFTHGSGIILQDYARFLQDPCNDSFVFNQSSYQKKQLQTASTNLLMSELNDVKLGLVQVVNRFGHESYFPERDALPGMKMGGDDLIVL